MSNAGWQDWTRGIIAGEVGYSGDPAPELHELASIAREGYRLTRMNFVPHAGTHLDAPAHFIDGGATIEQIALERLIGFAVVINVDTRAAAEGIGLEIVRRAVGMRKEFEAQVAAKADSAAGAKKAWMIFLRAAHASDGAVAWLRQEAAAALINEKFDVVGTDQSDLERPGDEGFPVHQFLLGRDILLLENVDLSDAEESIYEVMVLPLLFAEAEAAPARVIGQKIN